MGSKSAPPLADNPALWSESYQGLLSEVDARKFLGGWSAKTMFNLRQRGDLSFVKIGSRVMYQMRDLRKFVERQKVVRLSKGAA